MTAPRLVLALLAAAATTPIAAQTLRELTTEDGTRFVLVRTGELPIVHWVVVTPAGPFADPRSAPGLSHATLRAALAGPAGIGSTDPRAEAAAHAALDRVEQQAARARADGPLPQEVANALTQARDAVRKLADIGAFQRAIRATHSRDVEIVEPEGAGMLTVTTSVESLPAVAPLIAELRNDPILRHVQQIHADLHAEKVARRRASPLAALEDELLDLGFPGHPYARLDDASPTRTPISRALALSVWRQNHDPSRAIHVLTGGFDTEAVAATLQQVFSGSTPSSSPIGPFEPTRRPRGARRSSLTGAMPAVAVGVRIDAIGRPLTVTDVDDLAVLAEWLGGSESSLVARTLRTNGLGHASVRIEMPFPAGMPPVFGMLTVSAAPGTTTGAALAAAVDAALARACERGPGDDELSAAAAVVRARALHERLGPRDLAMQIALRCGVLGLAPKDAFDMPAAPDAARILALARTLFGAGERATVVQEEG